MQRVSILLVIALLILSITQPVYARLADWKLATVKQPDGMSIQIRLAGDESLHWYEDKDGFTVLKDSRSDFWCYAMLDRWGSLISSGAVVGRENPLNLNLKKHMCSPSALKKSHLRKQQRNNTKRSDGATGTFQNLVLLVKFKDQTPIKTRQEFDDLFNKKGYSDDGAHGSVKDYYLESSYNQCNLVSTVVDWIELDNGYAYYGENDADGYDLRPREMVAEALQKLEDSGFNFSSLDGNGDGKIDELTVIHSGHGEEYYGNDPDYIWSHQWELENPVVYDGVEISRYHTEPELDGKEANTRITRIAVVCHESGHFFGLPDLYDIDYSSIGVGCWDVMGGPICIDESLPSHFSAWSKIMLGWINPQLIQKNGTVELEPIEINKNNAKITYGFPDKQYLLIENRQTILFDSGLPKSGLCIWRIDDNKDPGDNTDNMEEWPGPGHDPSKHYRVALIQADGKWELENNENPIDGEDVFTQDNVNQLLAATTNNPNTGYYGISPDLDPTGVEILKIRNSRSSAISFNISGMITPPSPPQLISPSQGEVLYNTTSVTFKWSPAVDAEGEPVTHYLYYGKDPGFKDTTSILVASLDNTRKTNRVDYAIVGILGMLAGSIIVCGNSRRIKMWSSLGLCLILVFSMTCNRSGGSDDGNYEADNSSPAPKVLSYTVRGLTPNTIYYWKVEAKDASGGFVSSDTRSFIILK